MCSQRGRWIGLGIVFFITQAGIGSLLQLQGFQGYGETNAANYYFSSKNGNDNNTGTTSSSPWQSMTKLNQVAQGLRAGDVVYFEKGSEWDNVAVSISNISGNSGSKITFTTYGSGNKPRFKGSKVFSSFSQSGNLWTKTDGALPTYNAETALRIIPFVYVGGKKYDCSRYPNTGYLQASTGDVTNYLTDNTQNWSTDYWKGGMINARYLNWRWGTRRITGNNSSMIYFDDLDRTFERENTKYIIRNHVNACDQNGEWVQQDAQLTVYWKSDLNGQKVEVPVSHTIFNLTNCQYLTFDGLSIERAVVYGIHADGCQLTVQNCNVADAGGMLIYAEGNSVVKTMSNSFTGGKRGGVYYYQSHGEVSGNQFKQMYFDGIDNTEHTYGACIASWHSDGNFYSKYNRMDSINLGYNMHWSHDSAWIERNYITNFGFTVRDAAAIYFGSDFTGPNQGAYKYVRNNILINAVSDFVHGIYLDSNSNFIECDSNSIANTNIAVFIHVSQQNTLKNSRIINPAKGMTVYAWNQAIRMDEYSFQYGEGVTVNSNTLTDNEVVLGETSGETAVFLLNVSDLYSNRLDRNRYIDPFGGDESNFAIARDYSIYNYYNMPDWTSHTGYDGSSLHQVSEFAYNSKSGISSGDYVRLFTNPGNKSISYDLRNEGAYFKKTDGQAAGDFITIPPYYSVILFAATPREKQAGADEPVTPVPVVPVPVVPEPVVPEPVVETPVTPEAPVNHAPVINDQFFNLRESMHKGSNLGTLLASDMDADQDLEYVIISGNESGLFNLDAGNAELGINFEPDFSKAREFQLTIRVTDNGNPSLSDEASVKILQAMRSDKVYIDPTNTGDAMEDGSIDHPFNDWSDVKWVEGNTYLQKRGTIAKTGKIIIGANKVTLEAYGEGDMPVVESDARDFVFTVYEKNGITITNYDIHGESAVSLVYFLGASCDNNVIEQCRFTGGNNGIRIMDGQKFIIRYNSFSQHTEAVYSFAENTELYYNVFHNNDYAVDIHSYLSTAEIYNNVFYDNQESLVTSYSDLVLYNNIFYLTNVGAKALNINTQKLVSNYNIFYPQQTGFIAVNGKQFNTLTEFQADAGIDDNSETSDPEFEDAPTANFSLKSTSPAIDAGKQLLGLKKDLFGLAVPYGIGTDIGAVETKTGSGNGKSMMVSNLDVYPNPSRGDFEVNMQLSNPADVVLEVYSLQGKKVLSETNRMVDSGEFSRQMSVSDVPAGIYLVKATLGKEVLTSRLIIY